MTLQDQLSAAIYHREAERQNYERQIAFVTEQMQNSMKAHDLGIEKIRESIGSLKAIIGEAA